MNKPGLNKSWKRKGTTRFVGKTRMEIANEETLKMIRARNNIGVVGLIKRLFKN